MRCRNRHQKHGDYRCMIRRLSFAACLAVLSLSASAEAAPLTQIGSIPLGQVKGAISVLVMDYANQRLFAIEPAAGTLAVVNLDSGAVAQTVTGISEPRGLARAPTDDRLYVSTGQGKLMVYAGVPLKAEGAIEIGPNPGPLYYDAGSERIYLGFGGRKIGIIDSTHNKHWENIRLDGTPGPLALEDEGSRVFIGALSESRIIVADRDGNKQTASWSTGSNGDPTALALDEEAGRLIVAFRTPPGLAWIDLADGSLKGQAATCAEPGQLLSDPSRRRVYLTCGDGAIQVYVRDANGAYAAAGSIPTAKDAVAAVLVPTSGRLYLGVPAEGSRPAEIRIYAPAN
jgi:DNA-binding beta-propeller fold protein YncE